MWIWIRVRELLLDDRVVWAKDKLLLVKVRARVLRWLWNDYRDEVWCPSLLRCFILTDGIPDIKHCMFSVLQVIPLHLFGQALNLTVIHIISLIRLCKWPHGWLVNFKILDTKASGLLLGMIYLGLRGRYMLIKCPCCPLWHLIQIEEAWGSGGHSVWLLESPLKL